MGQGDGKARVDHRTAEIDRTRAAFGDDPAIIVDILLLVHDRRSRDEARELRRRLFPASPGGAAAFAALRQLGRIDAEEPHRYSAEVERISVGSAGRAADLLRRGREGQEKEGGGEDRK